MKSRNGPCACFSMVPASMSPAIHGANARSLAFSNVGAMTKPVSMRAMAASRWAGGAVCVPSACLSRWSTMRIRVKPVISSSSVGSSVRKPTKSTVPTGPDSSRPPVGTRRRRRPSRPAAPRRSTRCPARAGGWPGRRGLRPSRPGRRRSRLAGAALGGAACAEPPDGTAISSASPSTSARSAGTLRAARASAAWKADRSSRSCTATSTEAPDARRPAGSSSMRSRTPPSP